MHPANDFAHDLAEVWPQKPRGRRDRRKRSFRKRDLGKADSAGTVAGAISTSKRSPAAPLPARPQIKTRTLVGVALGRRKGQGLLARPFIAVGGRPSIVE